MPLTSPKTEIEAFPEVNGFSNGNPGIYISGNL
jgi:hypothetical protein